MISLASQYICVIRYTKVSLICLPNREGHDYRQKAEDKPEAHQFVH